PDAPVVYFATAAGLTPLRNATGLVGQVDYRGTLDLALQLQPDVRQVFVVAGDRGGGGGPGKGTKERAARPSLTARVAIEYLVGLPAAELERRAATLPDRSIVYYLTVARDGAGQNFHPLEYLDRLLAIVNAPIYCWVNSAMGHGIVGGRLKNQENET